MITDNMINGIDPVMVMNCKLGTTEREPEGLAFIRKVNQGDRQGVHADVEFKNETGRIFQRWVFAKDQAEFNAEFAKTE